MSSITKPCCRVLQFSATDSAAALKASRWLKPIEKDYSCRDSEKTKKRSSLQEGGRSMAANIFGALASVEEGADTVSSGAGKACCACGEIKPKVGACSTVVRAETNVCVCLCVSLSVHGPRGPCRDECVCVCVSVFLSLCMDQCLGFDEQHAVLPPGRLFQQAMGCEGAQPQVQCMHREWGRRARVWSSAHSFQQDDRDDKHSAPRQADAARHCDTSRGGPRKVPPRH